MRSVWPLYSTILDSHIPFRWNRSRTTTIAAYAIHTDRKKELTNCSVRHYFVQLQKMWNARSRWRMKATKENTHKYKHLFRFVLSHTEADARGRTRMQPFSFESIIRRRCWARSSSSLLFGIYANAIRSRRTGTTSNFHSIFVCAQPKHTQRSEHSTNSSHSRYSSSFRLQNFNKRSVEFVIIIIIVIIL